MESLEKKITKSLATSQNYSIKLFQQSFSCEADALKAVARFENEQVFASWNLFSSRKNNETCKSWSTRFKCRGNNSLSGSWNHYVLTDNRKKAERGRFRSIYFSDECLFRPSGYATL